MWRETECDNCHRPLWITPEEYDLGEVDCDACGHRQDITFLDQEEQEDE